MHYSFLEINVGFFGKGMKIVAYDALKLIHYDK